MARDEAAGWPGSFGRYAAKGAGGADVARWPEMFRAKPLIVDRAAVDRRTGERQTTHVWRAAVCVTGTIQPDKLARCLTPEYFGNGLAARVLLAMPPRRRKVWTDTTVADATRAGIEQLFAELLAWRGTANRTGGPDASADARPPPTPPTADRPRTDA